ncbi:MAG TPA: hypothetical protein PKC39_01375 [Ferruginibacter sp.]|nr:hypothetical protein [Ferruginibacter sp.]HMP19584.1 hypothetical protein [Ferruginibacter sp.]
MAQAENSTPHIAYKWLSYCLLGVFVYFWLFTLAMIFFKEPIQKITPRQAGLYKTFLRQEWHLFATPKLYNRQLYLVLIDANSHAHTDTIDIVQYSIAQKRSHAPFNSYQASLDRVLYWVMNRFEDELNKKKAALARQYPNMPDSFYVQQASAWLVADTARNLQYNNMVAFARNMLQQKNIATAGKQYRLLEQYTYIAPQAPPQGSYCESGRQVIFISPVQSF